eukprot:TRINITY_DN21340_c0_g1_i1.p1 TRINITY_DN21340_c0_g1~~TRINITY_DN21340_c0_g1_i1.p1  ORF type:complete len:625 (-),score=151.04 TRINITY_DN21340_c0_g1_i1:220-2094(-)
MPSLGFAVPAEWRLSTSTVAPLHALASRASQRQARPASFLDGAVEEGQLLSRSCGSRGSRHMGAGEAGREGWSDLRQVAVASSALAGLAAASSRARRRSTFSGCSWTRKEVTLRGNRGLHGGSVARQAAEANGGVLSVPEVYRLLRAAPGQAAALRLAAKLRRAAREGRALKDGRTINAKVVDEAMDALLHFQESQEEAVAEMERQQEVQAAGQDMEDDQAEEMQDGRGLLSETFGPGMEPRNVDRRMEQREQMEIGEQPEEQPREARDSFLTLPDASQVPEEIREKIVNHKYNYVDRVWSSPDSTSLPRAPALHVDNTMPKEAWLRLPQVCVNGMTNAGKSTLINHCIRWSYATKASSKPGRTTSIDFFLVNNRFVLVDLPGYPDPDEVAYMGVMRNWEAQWEDLVLSYLHMCQSGAYDLRLLLHLQLSKRTPSRMCKRLTAEAQRLDLPLMLVMTKDDQLKRGHDERNYFAKQIRKSLNFEGPHLHYTCESHLPNSRKVRKKLHRWIRSCVGARSMEACTEMLKEVGTKIAEAEKNEQKGKAANRGAKQIATEQSTSSASESAEASAGSADSSEATSSTSEQEATTTATAHAAADTVAKAVDEAAGQQAEADRRAVPTQAEA